MRTSTEERPTGGVVDWLPPSAPLPVKYPLNVQTHAMIIPKATDLTNPFAPSFHSTLASICPKKTPEFTPRSFTPTRYPPRIPTTSKITVRSGRDTTAPRSRGGGGGEGEWAGAAPHRLRRFDLPADPHDPDLRGQGGAGPTGHHERRQDRPQFPDERKGHRGSQEAFRTEFPQRVVPLEAEDHPGERGRQDDDEQGLRSDEVNLLHDASDPVRRKGKGRYRGVEEDRHPPHVADRQEDPFPDHLGQ